jgi:myo-inositol-1(or 4)-monophosphatase
MERGVITQGLVYDPNRDELFTATKGRGAFLNDRRIRVASRTRLEESLIGTGFPFRRIEDLDRYLVMLKAVMQGAGLRRPGAAARPGLWRRAATTAFRDRPGALGRRRRQRW